MKTSDIYIYDGTFPSLLNLINDLLKRNIKPFDICGNENDAPTLLNNVITLELNPNFDIKEIKLSSSILKTIYYVYLSEEEHKELIIFYFLLNAQKYQDKIFLMRNLKCVTKVLKIAKYVSNENHKLKGFTRFKEINNHILYAEISPTNNILPLLSNHFANRLKNEYWIIKDIERNIYSIYDTKKYYIISGKNINLKDITIDDTEQEIENLWQSFFDTIGIEARKNIRCQMNFMPKKYWKYITEMRKYNEESNNKQ